MPSTYTLAHRIDDIEIPANGILSRPLYDDDHLKVVLFAFSEGQELSEHTAAMPAVLHVLKGEARLTLGEDAVEARAGTWVHMPAHLRHAIVATRPLVMLLSLLKGARRGPS
jgi:quercetin dioxygenase-like cupin family protein